MRTLILMALLSTLASTLCSTQKTQAADIPISIARHHAAVAASEDVVLNLGDESAGFEKNRPKKCGLAAANTLYFASNHIELSSRSL